MKPHGQSRTRINQLHLAVGRVLLQVMMSWSLLGTEQPMVWVAHMGFRCFHCAHQQESLQDRAQSSQMSNVK